MGKHIMEKNWQADILGQTEKKQARQVNRMSIKDRQTSLYK